MVGGEIAKVGVLGVEVSKNKEVGGVVVNLLKEVGIRGVVLVRAVNGGDSEGGIIGGS